VRKGRNGREGKKAASCKEGQYSLPSWRHQEELLLSESKSKKAREEGPDGEGGEASGQI